MIIEVHPSELAGRATALLADGFRLALGACHDDRPRGIDRFRVVYLFLAPDGDRRVELHVPLVRDAALPSLARVSFPAGRFEREMHDLFGIALTDHPLPQRLVRHFHWPSGWYPMRSDAGPPPEFGAVDGPFHFRAVEGPGVYEIPVGPVHAGMIEPGHFRFSVVGETILNLKVRLWFVHRGVEKLFEGQRPDEASSLAEQISGDTSVGHAIAYARAIEAATGLVPAELVRRDRAVLLELERLYNHVGDIGALCNDVGFGVLNSHALRIKERLLRLNDRVTGHRLMRGCVRPGATTTLTLPDPAELAEIASDVAEVVEIALDNSVVHDRFAGTAVLTAEQARGLGTLGYVARASGLVTDARHDHPDLAPRHARTSFAPASGDVLARFRIRAAEFQESVEIITGLLGRVTSEPAQHAEPSGSGVGIIEGWRGTIVHRVEADHSGMITRLKIVDPSWFNWPALPVALADTIVPDFPLTNKSFNLSYAGNDL